jgi:hypothetical protein
MLSYKALSTLLAPVLLLKAAESSAVSNGKTALEHAVSRGDLKLAVSMLSASTLRINERDINRWTLLDITIRNRHTKFCSFLIEFLEKKERRNSREQSKFRQTLLTVHDALDAQKLNVYCPVVQRYMGASRVKAGLIQLLLAHGADVATQSPRYCSSPMVLAVLTAQHDGIRMLVAKGADVWALHKVKGFQMEFTVLHYAVFRRGLGTVRLLREGADIAEGTQAIMEALCCELTAWYQNAGWNEIAEVLKHPFGRPRKTLSRLAPFQASEDGNGCCHASGVHTGSSQPVAVPWGDCEFPPLPPPTVFIPSCNPTTSPSDDLTQPFLSFGSVGLLKRFPRRRRDRATDRQ